MSSIKFSNIHKSFGKNKIINNFNLKGKEDEFEIVDAPASYGWLPPAFMPWIFQDYEKFFNSQYSKSGNDIWQLGSVWP